MLKCLEKWHDDMVNMGFKRILASYKKILRGIFFTDSNDVLLLNSLFVKNNRLMMTYRSRYSSAISKPLEVCQFLYERDYNKYIEPIVLIFLSEQLTLHKVKIFKYSFVSFDVNEESLVIENDEGRQWSYSLQEFCNDEDALRNTAISANLVNFFIESGYHRALRDKAAVRKLKEKLHQDKVANVVKIVRS